MDYKKSILLISIVSLVSLFACNPEPELSPVPSIRYLNTEFIRGTDFVNSDGIPVTAADTVAFTFSFEDGDGDLGMLATETNPPYHAFNLFSRINGTPLAYISGDIDSQQFIQINDSDTLPPFNCDTYYRYAFGEVEAGTDGVDTLYIRKNPRSENFYINFFIKNAQGSFEPFYFSSAAGSCPTLLNQRFGPLFEDDTPKALVGDIRFKYVTEFFPEFLYDREEVMKVQIYILDRAGNKSNIAESPEFTFKQIEK
ncbi:hypothetical protein QWY31_02610 [Cytophagales bacterium LB-30]|uniref:Lipoprotein n=1 Tax=Shiella aurantiaca TaxID=3058365 RepID=A0ABT8F234_9BACT|nr:hypothetical protein [Shiella aurantiaca]MDN4164373.1 hypothetical protein [Shiella aurantiaca]